MSDDWAVGEPVTEYPVAKPFGRDIIKGSSITLLPLDYKLNVPDLYASFANSDPDNRLWTYMSQGPFSDEVEFRNWLDSQESSNDPLFYTLIPSSSIKPEGMASFMRVDIPNGVAEIGNIWFAPSLQRTRAATETIFLMMRHVLETQSCRRLEWKCNALNAPSRRAAERFGFSFEGVFLNHMVVKGRNRDTAWFAVIEEDWPSIRTAFETWLDDDNFEESRVQKQSLSNLTKLVRA
jgi:RimJ/RimL family protein N-acetyltransferase